MNLPFMCNPNQRGQIRTHHDQLQSARTHAQGESACWRSVCPNPVSYLGVLMSRFSPSHCAPPIVVLCHWPPCCAGAGDSVIYWVVLPEKKNSRPSTCPWCYSSVAPRCCCAYGGCLTLSFISATPEVCGYITLARLKLCQLTVIHKESVSSLWRSGF